MHRKVIIAILLAAGIGILTACQQNQPSDASNEKENEISAEMENGISAIEDAMNQPTTSQSTTTQSATQPTVPQSTTAQSTTEKEQANKKKKMDIDEVRSGTSEDTIAAPDDFPDAYDYGSGRISDYSEAIC